MKTKDLINLIKNRRSVRIFTGKKVSKKSLEQIIEAGIWAPTGCNNQELRFLILEKEKDLQEMISFKPFFQGVSHFILIFFDLSLPKSRYMYLENRHERHMPDIDGGLAAQNMMLMAKTLGLETCVFNLSKEFNRKPAPAPLWKKVVRLLRTKLHWGTNNLENNFEYALRHHFNIPENLQIICGLAIGYGKFVPDPAKTFHGARPILRKAVKYYLVK